MKRQLLARLVAARPSRKHQWSYRAQSYRAQSYRAQDDWLPFEAHVSRQAEVRRYNY